MQATISDGQYALEEKEFRVRLEKALSDLPESQRMVFLLNRVENMSYRSMADFLGLSIKSIERRMHLALQNLRQVFQDQRTGPW
ncbi:MAG: sigma-70 family RNA polymerase sigma factor [Saprospiraceae bacterium]|nr:sigma-70 family RNA polymerase sigma factor [Saprospiraceae bacterium]